MSTSKPGRASRILAKLHLVLFGLLAGVALAEIGLRLGGYSYPEFYQLDQTRGYALRPGMEGWYSKEGSAYVHINSDGLRDREHAKTKPPNTLRIAVIGDSYPEAFSVAVEQTFWSIMGARLQACGYFPGKTIEVINFGVSGYGTAQELITLREHVWDYSPDIVLLALTTNNDITDNSRVLKRTDQIPYFVYRDGRLVLDDSFKTERAFQRRQTRMVRLIRWARDQSRLLQATIQAHHGFKILLASWRARVETGNASMNSEAEPKSDLFSRAEELGTDNVVYLEPENAVWNDAWRVTEGLIVTMRDEVRSRGAKFLVVTLSNGPQVLPDRNSRQWFVNRFGISDLFYPDNRIKSLCLRENIPMIMLAPELQAYAEQNRATLHGFGNDIGNGHWNVLGHRIAGEMIAEKLCEGVVRE